MNRIAAVLNLLTQLNKLSSNNFIRHECQNGILGGCFFILFDGYFQALKRFIFSFRNRYSITAFLTHKRPTFLLYLCVYYTTKIAKSTVFMRIFQ